MSYDDAPLTGAFPLPTVDEEVVFGDDRLMVKGQFARINIETDYAGRRKKVLHYEIHAEITDEGFVEREFP